MKLLVIQLGQAKREADRALLHLPEDSRARLTGRTETALLQSLLAEIAVRLEGMHRFRVPREEIVILRSPQGKPSFADMPLAFNVSHSDRAIVCAFDRLPVGVDVQRIKPTKTEALARCLSADERAEIDRAADKTAAFFRIWTAKESVIKQRGGSLARELTRLDVSSGVSLNGEPLPVTLRSFRLDLLRRMLLGYDPSSSDMAPPYSLSVCLSEDAAQTIRVVFRTAEEVLREWNELPL